MRPPTSGSGGRRRRALTQPSRTPRLGISTPGFMCPGALPPTSPDSRGCSSCWRPPNVFRLPKRVRFWASGCPADIPADSVAAHAGRLAEDPLAPLRELVLGSTGGAFCAATTAPLPLACTTTRKRMFACDSAAVFGALADVLAGHLRGEGDPVHAPGTTSRLPPSWGTQKEWITSGPCRWKATVSSHGDMRLVGGDHVLGRDSGTPTTTDAPPRPPGGRWRRAPPASLKITRTVGTAKITEDGGEGDGPAHLEDGVAVDLLGNGRAGPVAEAPAHVEQADAPPR